MLILRVSGVVFRHHRAWIIPNKLHICCSEVCDTDNKRVLKHYPWGTIAINSAFSLITNSKIWLIWRNQVPVPQAYIKKGRTPIQVLPVPNVYTIFCDKT